MRKLGEPLSAGKKGPSGPSWLAGIRALVLLLVTSGGLSACKENGPEATRVDLFNLLTRMCEKAGYQAPDQDNMLRIGEALSGAAPYCAERESDASHTYLSTCGGTETDAAVSMLSGGYILASTMQPSGRNAIYFCGKKLNLASPGKDN